MAANPLTGFEFGEGIDMKEAIFYFFRILDIIPIFHNLLI